MSDILTQLDSLTPEELQKVGNLINKFAKRHPASEDEIDEQPQKAQRTNNRPQQRRETPRQQPKGSTGRQHGRREPKNPVQNKGQNVRRDRGQSKNFGRTESVQLTGENKFLTMRESKEYKQDSVDDKKLWKGRQAMPRPEKYEPIEVQCTVCKYYYDIHPSLVIMDADTGRPNYQCNNCIRKE